MDQKKKILFINKIMFFDTIKIRVSARSAYLDATYLKVLLFAMDLKQSILLWEMFDSDS